MGLGDGCESLLGCGQGQSPRRFFRPIFLTPRLPALSSRLSPSPASLPGPALSRSAPRRDGQACPPLRRRGNEGGASRLPPGSRCLERCAGGGPAAVGQLRAGSDAPESLAPRPGSPAPVSVLSSRPVTSRAVRPPSRPHTPSSSPTTSPPDQPHSLLLQWPASCGPRQPGQALGRPPTPPSPTGNK